MLDQTEPVRQEPIGTIDAQLAACPAAVTTPEFRASTMTRKRDQVSHLVQVARFRIETVVVEIRGDDIGELELIGQGLSLPALRVTPTPLPGTARRGDDRGGVVDWRVLTGQPGASAGN